jgi:two-component system OmpR family sensor kinase
MVKSMKSPVSHWSLVSRLVLGVVVLSAAGFAASDIAAQSMLKSFLVHQIDNQLHSVVGGSIQRVQQAGVAPRETNDSLDGEDDDAARAARKAAKRAAKQATRPAPTPLQSVPTSTSITLLDVEGKIVGAIGGDLNQADIADYVTGLTSSDVLSHNGTPFTLEAANSEFRVLAQVLPNGVGSIVVAQSLSDVKGTLAQLQFLFILIGLILLALIALAARAVVKIGLKPLASVEDTAERIAEGDLSARLPDAKPGTEVGRLVSSLNAMLSRIEESFAARTESENKLRRFVADASHELRTPITAIRGFSELHRQGAVGEGAPTKELIGRIEGESKRMGSLVEDLLLLARLDQAREMDAKPVDLAQVVTDAVISARAAGPEHPVTFSAPTGDFYTLGDVNRIHQVVANLLANARAHTPAGTPITVSLEHGSDGIRISVADKGPGLSEEHKAKIFERFYRADTSRQRSSEEGSGLGLSIVDAVMRAHGGSVSVESELGKGATFTLFFPNKTN